VKTNELGPARQSRHAFEIYELLKNELVQLFEVVSRAENLRDALASFVNNSHLLQSIEKLIIIFNENKKRTEILEQEILLKNGEVNALRTRFELSQKQCANLIVDNAFLKSNHNGE
jgi:hypothetical protein